MAHVALANMRKNRALRRQRVDALKRDILSGRWSKNGETVKQGVDGLWEDGQHRFTAIYSTGIAVPVLVVSGIEKSATWTIDAVAARTYSDRLRMNSVAVNNVLGSVVRRMWYWDERKQFMSASRDITPSDLELEAYRKNHEAELKASLPIAEHAKACKLTSTTLATIAIVLRRIDREAAEKFLNQLTTGTMLNSNDPAYVLRERLAREAESQMRNYETRRALVFIAWNHYRDGAKIEKLSLPRGGEITNRNYPLPY
jgi:uncharacterized protein (DUF2267 family)